MAKNWQHLVETAPARTYRRMAKDKDQLLARYVPKKAFDKGDPPTYLYASGDLNRCNPAGVNCIYFGEGPETAREEFDSYYTKPLSELGFYARAKFQHILDLTDPGTRKHFGLTGSDFTRSYVTRSGALIPLQQIGKAVSRQTRIAAIRFPSNAMQKSGKTGFNLVAFQDTISSPDSLEIMEGSKIVEKWPKA